MGRERTTGEDWATILFLTRIRLISETPFRSKKEPQSARGRIDVRGSSPLRLRSDRDVATVSRAPCWVTTNTLMHVVELLAGGTYARAPPRGAGHPPSAGAAHPRRARNALRLGDDRSSGCRGRTGNRDGAAFSPSFRSDDERECDCTAVPSYNERNIWICFNRLAGLIWNTFGEKIFGLTTII